MENSFKFSTKSEIGNFNRWNIRFTFQENILGFQVSMDKIAAMDVLQPLKNALH